MQVHQATEGELKRALRSLAAGVTIITVTDDDGDAYGMTATAFCPVSLEPPLVLVCISHDTRTYQLITKANRFGVNVMGREGVDLASFCARPGVNKQLDPGSLDADHFDPGAAAVRGAMIYLGCTVQLEQKAGSHSIFVGRVQAVGQGEPAEPLVYHDGNYHRVEVLEDAL